MSEYSPKPKMEQQNIYVQRINAVLNHIRENLWDDLSLQNLADISGFSPFHFHRIFKSVTDETVNQATTRLRLERAVALLRSSPKLLITEAALESGFQTITVFSRTFKRFYGINASQWDRKTPLKERKNGQIIDGFPYYTEDELRREAQAKGLTVRLRELPEQRIAYIRVYNSYHSSHILSSYQQLVGWYSAEKAARRNSVGDSGVLYGISQDNPDITPFELCRFDWCLSVPNDWQTHGESIINMRTLPACTIAYVHAQGDIHVLDLAWQFLFRVWLPQSHFQPDNLPAMEIYRKHPAEHGWDIYQMDCALPIVKL